MLAPSEFLRGRGDNHEPTRARSYQRGRLTSAHACFLTSCSLPAVTGFREKHSQEPEDGIRKIGGRAADQRSAETIAAETSVGSFPVRRRLLPELAVPERVAKLEQARAELRVCPPPFHPAVQMRLLFPRENHRASADVLKGFANGSVDAPVAEGAVAPVHLAYLLVMTAIGVVLADRFLRRRMAG